jgi:hypothetical protein
MDTIMKTFLYICLILAVPVFHGCASTPQSQINASAEFWQDHQQKIGVFVSDIPEVKGHITGAACLLCYATAAAINADLNSHVKTLSSEDLADLQTQLINALKEKGINAVEVKTEFDIDTVKKFESKQLNVAKKDFRPLKTMEGLDKVLVVDLRLLGTIRNFANYVPIGEPIAALKGLMYIVNLEDNHYEFYEVIDVTKIVGNQWDEPNYPAVTNAYYTIVELGKAKILDLSVDAPPLATPVVDEKVADAI